MVSPTSPSPSPSPSPFTITAVLQGIVPTNKSRRESALRKRVDEYSSFVKQHFGDSDGLEAIFTSEQTKALNQVLYNNGSVG